MSTTAPSSSFEAQEKTTHKARNKLKKKKKKEIKYKLKKNEDEPHTRSHSCQIENDCTTDTIARYFF